MAESFVQVNVNATAGKKLKTYESVDGSSNLVESEAVTLTDSAGAEVLVATEQTQQDVLTAIRTLSTGVFSDPFTQINGDVAPVVAGMPVAQPTTSLRRAVAGSGAALATVIGIVVVGAAMTLPARALPQGVLTLPTAAWDAVTGGSGGLTPGARYYLDPSTLGGITTTPPSTSGQYLVVLGSAISTTTMLVNIEPPILL